MLNMVISGQNKQENNVNNININVLMGWDPGQDQRHSRKDDPLSRTKETWAVEWRMWWDA